MPWSSQNSFILRGWAVHVFRKTRAARRGWCKLWHVIVLICSGLAGFTCSSRGTVGFLKLLSREQLLSVWLHRIIQFLRITQMSSYQIKDFNEDKTSFWFKLPSVKTMKPTWCGENVRFWIRLNESSVDCHFVELIWGKLSAEEKPFLKMGKYNFYPALLSQTNTCCGMFFLCLCMCG